MAWNLYVKAQPWLQQSLCSAVYTAPPGGNSQWSLLTLTIPDPEGRPKQTTSPSHMYWPTQICVKIVHNHEKISPSEMNGIACKSRWTNPLGSPVTLLYQEDHFRCLSLSIFDQPMRYWWGFTRVPFVAVTHRPSWPFFFNNVVNIHPKKEFKCYRGHMKDCVYYCSWTKIWEK